MAQRNNVITASRQNAFHQCKRKHYWQYEIGLRPIAQTDVALNFGSAWARGIEARWQGAEYDLALERSEGDSLDEYSFAMFAALLAGYYDWWKQDPYQIAPEVPFRHPSEFAGWTHEGKLDGLGTNENQQSIIVESKTTASDLSKPDYWLRLRFNIQVFQYVAAARLEGWDIAEVIYDVTRKPRLRPKFIHHLDDNEKKIVRDRDGNRIFNQKQQKQAGVIVMVDGAPRQTEDKARGWLFDGHTETAEEFQDRIYKEVTENPIKYFVRRNVPLMDEDMREFQVSRFQTTRLIELIRGTETDFERPEDAWPRSVSQGNCKYCAFQNFCLQNITVTPPDELPGGFAIQPFNPELDYDSTESAAENANNDAESSG